MIIKRIKVLTLFLSLSAVLATGCSPNTTELASNSNPALITTSSEEQQIASKKVRYAQLKSDFEIEKKKLESMPSSTPEEIEINVEQGRKVKEIGWELGLLEKEVDPDYPRRELEGKISSLKQGNELLLHYKRTNDPRYEALFKLDNYKKEQITQIEKEYQEKTKSIAQLLQEYDELINMTEVPNIK
ncbi:hypothetical protein ACP26L_07660 [Paenibacillus sp. S-38]|uniref:hypothetical protein n=1 Tax=Paenibacillus sp. S-38 TaxID=3416710 RepID=UPI003CF56D34